MVQTLRANRTSNNGASALNTVTRAFSFTAKGILWADAATDLDFDNAVNDTLMYRSNWTTGDLMIQGRKLGRSVDELAVMFGYQNAQSIDNIISTCQKIPIAIRRESSVLSFTHHQTVKDSGTVDEIDGWLARAETEKWSVAALRGALQAFRNEQKKADEKAQADKRAANGDAPIVNPPSANDAPIDAPLGGTSKGIGTHDSGTVIQGVDNRQPVITPESVTGTDGMYIAPHHAAKIRELAKFGNMDAQDLLNRFLNAGIMQEEKDHRYSRQASEARQAELLKPSAPSVEKPSTVVDNTSDTPSDIRQDVLAELFAFEDNTPLRVFDIAKNMKISAEQVSVIIAELLEAGAIVEQNVGSAGSEYSLAPVKTVQDASTVVEPSDAEKAQFALSFLTAEEQSIKVLAGKFGTSQKEVKTFLDLTIADGSAKKTAKGYRLATRFDNMNGG